MISPYESYVYAYPHKTAYRPLDPRPALTDVWRGERAGSFYAHIPFCEMRCGFCNLFTRTGAPEDLVAAYLDALERETLALADALDPAFTTAAIGGGTPTYLSPAELTRLFDVTGKITPYGEIPLSVETSPATATPDRLAVLKERGTTRVSIGVQSFVDEEARAAVRPQKRAEVDQALDAIRATGFPILNIDLIYGIDGQTVASWRHSLETALRWAPEELYLYPLYVRPLTGLGKIGRDWDDQRMELYREGRDLLLDRGYEQVSMRMFRLPGTGTSTGYCCQTDGMASVGCGARSYTGTLHYSHEYAVGARHVRSIIDDYVRRDDFTEALIGFTLTEAERRRRHTIQSLLQKDGLDLGLYRSRFGGDPDVTAVPAEWLVRDGDVLRLTDDGLAHSDVVGPALFSAEVRGLMASNDAR